MTEAEWDSCAYPVAMLRAMLACRRVSDRRWRLFTCGCCRRIWDRFPDPRNRDLVATVEEFPDGSFEDPALDDAITASSACDDAARAEPAFWVAKHLGRGFYKFSAAVSAMSVISQVLRILADGREGGAGADPWGLPDEALAGLARDVFGPMLFRAKSVRPDVLAWNDRLAVRLARAVYDDRRWGHMPLLGDALLDAGCDDEEILRHCREPGASHARGCWVIDLLLGKEQSMTESGWRDAR
jgi:hypothetical protein